MGDQDEELPALSFAGLGDYRLRIHARGRDSAVDLASDETREWYVIQAGPAAAQDIAILRATDNYGATVRTR
ncbi:hypothetical protein [Streptomyces sp. NPDC049915]|uniref:hypothetical protein n=1 Tax=Streptomyces sp. NPDC049915 TaxID=3155510 RepID=UPI003448B118